MCLNVGAAAASPDMLHTSIHSSAFNPGEARTGHELPLASALERNKLRDSLSLKECSHQPTSDAGHGPLSSARFV